MAERYNKCPKCSINKCVTVQIYNPEANTMNAKAQLRCLDCENVWDGIVTSPRYKEAKEKGEIK